MIQDYYVSTDKNKLDIVCIHEFLCLDSYWAQGRDLKTIRKTIENSICFGVYQRNEQVGFARVVTDKAVFAWVADVFILEKHRGFGLGKLLIDSIMDHTELQHLKRWVLATDDAHGLYEHYGFTALKQASKFMQFIP